MLGSVCDWGRSTYSPRSFSTHVPSSFFHSQSRPQSLFSAWFVSSSFLRVCEISSVMAEWAALARTSSARDVSHQQELMSD